MARGPWVPGLTGTSVSGKAEFSDVLTQPKGSIRLRATPQQVAQVASYRHLRDYPLIVMVGFDTDTVFGPYRALRGSALASGAAITCAVGLIGFFWVRQKRRSLMSHRAFTVTLDTISQGILMVDRQGGVSVINPRALELLKGPGGGAETCLDDIVTRASELMRGCIVTSPVPVDGGTVDGALQDSKLETILEDGTIVEVRTHPLADGGIRSKLHGCVGTTVGACSSQASGSP